MRMRLGLDLGTNSLGWCLLELNEKGNPFKIIKSGVRIFSSGREAKTYTTLNAERRTARSARRNRDRYLQRRTYLMQTLIKLGLMPQDEKDRKNLQLLDPYELRAKSIKEKIDLCELGRVIFHLNQRRGFKSNRKDAGKKDVGDMKKSIKLREKIEGFQTVGEYLCSFHKDGKPVRARRREENKGLYDFCIDRPMLEEEFDLIWKNQQKFYGKNSILSDENKEKIHKIIFFQRPLKPQIVGKCFFYPEEERAPKASIDFQKFRLWQNVNNLKWRTPEEYKFQELSVKIKKYLFKKIFSQQKMVVSKIEELLEKKLDKYEIICNYRSQSAKLSFKGNELDKAFKKVKKKRLTDEQKDKLISKLSETVEDDGVRRFLEDDEIRKWLQEEKFEKDDIDYILGNFKVDLPKGHSDLSIKAIKDLLPSLEEGHRYDEACKKVFGNHSEQRYEKTLSKLPPYNTFEPLQKYIVPRKKKNKNEEEDKRISNPTVHIALNQLRLVVNDLITHFGNPEEIVIELTRDLPMGSKTKREYNKKQEKNRKNNERINSELLKLKQICNRDNRERYKLWEELAKSPNDRKCPYSGKTINIKDLFSNKNKIEVDHILPYSKTLDDSLSNKVVCFREENRKKTNKTPFETYGSNTKIYNKILNRVQKFKNKRKIWRFEEDALDKFKEEGGFLERQLNDIRYISKIARIYLISLIEDKSKCWVVKGQLTTRFRYYWGCNKILSNGENIKNRDDHRHHALDAAVIGCTSRSMIQKISTHAGRTREGLEKPGENNPTERIFKNYPKPWGNFRKDLENSISKIIVSHKPTRHYEGQIHEDTAYGVKGGPNLRGEYMVESRLYLLEKNSKKKIKLKKAHTRKMVGIKYKEKLEQIVSFDENKKEEKIKEFKEKYNIKKLRIREHKSVFPVGEGHTGFIGGNNWAYDVFEKSDGSWGKYVISVFEAYKHISQKPKNFPKRKWLEKFQPWKKNCHEAKLVARLHANDLFILQQDCKNQIFRVSSIGGDTQIVATEHYLGLDEKTYPTRNMKKLKEQGFKKINISPAGFYHAVENY